MPDNNITSHETNTEKRRQMIYEYLKTADAPVTASRLASLFSVSRQIIVGDIAILRASGCNVTATPKGYMMDKEKTSSSQLQVGMIVCKRTPEQLREELYTIVDFGATVIDVTIEHAIYGEISGSLDLSSRYDVDLFINKVEKEKNSAPISCLTDGVHIHRISYKDKETFNMIKASLKSKNILME